MTVETRDLPASPIPDHVPRELILPIGLSEGPEFLADPYGLMASLHETHPALFYSTFEHGENAWMVTHHDDILFVLRNPQIFTTRGTFQFPRSPENYFDFIPIEIDPPDHKKYRDILNAMFAPPAIAKLESTMRRLAIQLIDGFIDNGECEFTAEFSRPFPVSVFLGLMGLPLNMRDTFVGWAMGLLHAQDKDAAAHAMIEIATYLSQVIKEKTQSPGDDVISTIVQARPEGEPLGDNEVFGFVFFLFIAGLDTVFATLNNAFLWLATHPQQRREIIENPNRIDGAVDELLRYFGVTFSGRLLARDYEMHGVKMKKGDRIICVLPAANFDPAVFQNPTAMDFQRPLRPNLSFSGGPHGCMGRHLARLEMKISVQEFLRRIPDFQLKEGAGIEYWPGGVVGPKALPFTW